MAEDPRDYDAPQLPRRSRAVIAGRVGFALLSVLVLAVTGYGWANYGELRWALSTSSATDGAAADGATDILLVGLDSRTDSQGRPLPDDVLRRLRAGDNPANLTDTLMLVHIPSNGAGATAMSLPRDTYTSIPGHGEHKINSAYGRGKSQAAEALTGVADPAERERRAADAGRRTLTDTVQQLTGVQVDHYAEVNLLGFAQLTEAIGGVPVCLREAVHDPYSGADFRAGHQLISGAQALSFVRQRHGLPRGDLDRMVRQQAFLAGFVRPATSGGLLAQPAKLGGLIDSARRSIVLDRDWDLLAFAQRMQGLAAGDVAFSTIPIQDAAYDTPDGEAVRVDPLEVSRAVHHAAHGRPAPAQETGESGQETGETAQETGEFGQAPTGEGASTPETGEGSAPTTGETGGRETQTGEQGTAETGTGSPGTGAPGTAETGSAGTGSAETGTGETTGRAPATSEHPASTATGRTTPQTTPRTTSEYSAEPETSDSQQSTGETSAPQPQTEATSAGTDPTSPDPTGPAQPVPPDALNAGGLTCVN
ncbi:LCP family protein [Saccharopolyspora sp.]|uniref:LCP family protein n=1 Tax=Saccharopolyspora sp. TaxID=33915 RepID=UPI0025F11078|nr:LCP family protein [Saccharopolyspora sp.]